MKSLSWLLIMSSQRLHGGRVTLFLLLSCCGLSFATTPTATQTPQPAAIPTPAPGATSQPTTIYVSPGNPASVNTSPFGDTSANYTTPSLRALPVESSDGGIDASTQRKFYTLSASLREIYDDNVNTTNVNKEASLETEVSPSILVDFPNADGDFTGRYTFGLTYYGDAPGSKYNPNANGGGNTTNYSGTFQMTHDAVAQYTHNFSNRFQLALAEELRYDIQPNILQSVGTNYQNGAYLSNLFNGTLSAQWSPKFSTTATFANTVIRYDDSVLGEQQNSVEDNGSFTASYAFLPKIAASAGFQVDDITYQSGDRGYTSYTFFGGGNWQALPSLSVTGRGGVSVTETVGDDTDEISPYAALQINWNLGARSALAFSYSHEVTPASQVGAEGQLSDRFSANFSYQITPRLSTHLLGAFTDSTVTQDLAVSNSGLPNDYEQLVYEIDTGLAYSYNSNLSFDGGFTFSGVNSDIDNNNYTRDEVYIGVRGTY